MSRAIVLCDECAEISGSIRLAAFLRSDNQGPLRQEWLGERDRSVIYNLVRLMKEATQTPCSSFPSQ
ncbi:hypothetical protein SRHO_G00156240 [Serrasalmus rhombeus]